MINYYSKIYYDINYNYDELLCTYFIDIQKLYTYTNYII